jgi:2-aminoadipate transaminase
LEVDDPDGGMFVWARVRDVDDATPVLARALDQGMAFVPGSVFRSDDAPDPRIRLCFTTVDEPGLWEAMRRLDRAVAAVAGSVTAGAGGSLR